MLQRGFRARVTPLSGGRKSGKFAMVAQVSDPSACVAINGGMTVTSALGD
ncbi:MAG: hypothetical protein NVS4B6_27350 [Mycobacterium sp.]